MIQTTYTLSLVFSSQLIYQPITNQILPKKELRQPSLINSQHSIQPSQTFHLGHHLQCPRTDTRLGGGECCSQGWLQVKMGYKIAKSRAVNGQSGSNPKMVDKWWKKTWHDQEGAYKVKRQLEFKSSRIEATESEERWAKLKDCLKEWTESNHAQIGYKGAQWYKDWAYKRRAPVELPARIFLSSKVKDGLLRAGNRWQRP